jgi:hypothetical protein
LGELRAHETAEAFCPHRYTDRARQARNVRHDALWFVTNLKLGNERAAMNNLHILFLAPILVLAVGCRDSSTIQNAKQHAGDLAQKANETLARIQAGDLQGLRTQIRELKSSLATKDFSKARECSEQIDKLMQTRFVAQSVEFLRIESAEGSQKAKAAILDYMAQHDLGEAEIKAFREILGSFENEVEETTPQERIGLVAMIVGFACAQKMGCKESAAITSVTYVVMAELFGIEVPEAAPILSK